MKITTNIVDGCLPTDGGIFPTGTDECAGDVAADAVAQVDDPAGSIQ